MKIEIDDVHYRSGLTYSDITQKVLGILLDVWAGHSGSPLTTEEFDTARSILEQQGRLEAQRYILDKVKQKQGNDAT